MADDLAGLPRETVVGRFGKSTGMFLAGVGPEEHARYVAALDDLLHLDRRDSFAMVGRNYSTLMDRFDFVRHLLQAPGIRRPLDLDRLSTSMTSSAVNFASTAGLYLDHQEYEIKRRFGSSSDQAAKFKAATASAFDTSFAYKFFSGYRNYVMHCGLPYCTISTRLTDDETVEAKFSLNRDDLLEQHSWKASVRSALVEQGPELAFESLVQEMMEQLAEIERCSLQQWLGAALEQDLSVLERLIEAVDNLAPPPEDKATESEPYVYVVGKVKVEDGGKRLLPSFRQLHGSQCEALRRMRNSDPSGEALRVELPERLWKNRHPLREHFTVDNRGLRMLMTYLQEGGPTARVVEDANRIITEDDSVTPLLTQLMEAGVLSLFLAAGAVDTEAEALLASLIFGNGDDVDELSSSTASEDESLHDGTTTT